MNKLHAALLTLGLPPGTSWEEVKKSHRRVAAAYHEAGQNARSDERKEEYKEAEIAVNNARDDLRNHFESVAHKSVGPCDCRETVWSDTIRASAAEPKTAQKSASAEEAKAAQRSEYRRTTPPPVQHEIHVQQVREVELAAEEQRIRRAVRLPLRDILPGILRIFVNTLKFTLPVTTIVFLVHKSGSLSLVGSMVFSFICWMIATAAVWNFAGKPWKELRERSLIPLQIGLACGIGAFIIGTPITWMGSGGDAGRALVNAALFAPWAALFAAAAVFLFSWEQEPLIDALFLKTELFFKSESTRWRIAAGEWVVVVLGVFLLASAQWLENTALAKAANEQFKQPDFRNVEGQAWQDYLADKREVLHKTVGLWLTKQQVEEWRPPFLNKPADYQQRADDIVKLANGPAVQKQAEKVVELSARIEALHNLHSPTVEECDQGIQKAMVGLDAANRILATEAEWVQRGYRDNGSGRSELQMAQQELAEWRQKKADVIDGKFEKALAAAQTELTLWRSADPLAWPLKDYGLKYYAINDIDEPEQQRFMRILDQQRTDRPYSR